MIILDFKSHIIPILCFLLYSLDGNTQELAVRYGASKVLKHSDKSTFDAPPYTYMWQVAYVRKPFNTSWHRYWGKPNIGLMPTYIHYGDPEVLGTVWGIMPFIETFLWGHKKASKLSIRLGVGVGYHTQPYNRLYNPLNNAISSHWNNLSQMDLLWTFPIAKGPLSIQIGGHLTHVSNGRTSYPNSGINIGGAILGIHYRWANINETESYFDKKDSVLVKKWSLEPSFGFGFNEYTLDGGPQYKVYTIQCISEYGISPYWRVHTGLYAEYNQSIFQFHYLDFDNEHTARLKATRTSLLLGSTAYFGNISARMTIGIYLPYPTIKEERPFLYLQPSIQYHFPKVLAACTPFVGIGLKSHLAVAQHLAVISGVQF